MFDHVTIGVSDANASRRFYSTVLAELGLTADHDEWGDFSIAADGRPATRNLHIAFYAATTDLVDAFHRAGVEAGYTDDGAPGPRPQYGSDYYGGFLLDPDGNSVEAVTGTRALITGAIDHVWLRSKRIPEQRAFYETIAPYAGFALDRDDPEWIQFVAPRSSFSFVAGDAPTEQVHMAWPAATNEVVDAFHRAAVEAGYESNGAPGERAVYHPGYYGAFIRDPDGHNVEVVNHNREAEAPV
ncbi:MAG TPA: VOC family protein [Solirubrobacter sp.]|nr:VOC family protein [Solirubrobacter sp.]